MKSTKRLTLADVEARLRGDGRGYTLVGEFNGASRKSEFACLTGHRWQTRVSNVLSQTGCPHCASTGPLQESEVNERIAHRGFSIHSGFVNGSVKANFSCNRGHVWSASPDNILRGRGCPHCSGVARYSTDSLNKTLAPRGIKLVGEVTAGLRARFICSNGHEWEAARGNVVAGGGCPKCADYGFNPAKSAHLYVVRMYNETQSIVGYGITRNLVERLNRHGRMMRKGGFMSQFAHAVFFKNGADAAELEKRLKQSLPRVPCEVTGFKTECTSDDHYGRLFELIGDYCETQECS